MLVAVAGHHRSGTTALMSTMNTHPDLMITHEMGAFYKVGMTYTRYRNWILRRWWAQKGNPIFRKEKFSKDDPAAVVILENLWITMRFLRHIRSASDGDGIVSLAVVKKALSSLFPKKTVLGDKYPDYGFRLNDLAGISGLDTVFIYRDPRDVASSTLKKSRSSWAGWAPTEITDPSGIASRWVRMIGLWKRNEDQIYAICYEDLVINPSMTLKRLAKWLRITDEFSHGAIHAASVGKHRKHLSDKERDTIVTIAGPTMKALGYSIS